MSNRRRQSAAQTRNRIGVAILSLVALATVLAAWALFMRLLASERDMDAIVREDAMWAVFQTDRHMRDVESLARMTAETGSNRFHGALVRSYDILYSRVTLLDRGSFLLDRQGRVTVAGQARDVSDFVRGLAPRIDALAPDAPGYLTEVATLAGELRRWVGATNQLLLDANAGMNALRVGERELRAGIQDQLAWLALVLILAFLGIFALILVQLRRMSRVNMMMALLQERTRRKALRAQAASRAKSAFLATMSHEIRTPLNGIIGSAELLSMAPLPDRQGRQLDSLRASAVLLRDLIDGILDFSRLEAGVIERTCTDTDLAALGHLLATAFEGQAAEAGLDLSIDMPQRRVRVSDTRLRQVLTNLIGNALKFTPRGAVRVRGTLPSDTLLRIEVEDDGIGIAAGDLPRLFREFSQIEDTHARRYGGSGLGLAICRRVVEGLGGRIGVDSTPGKGSLFWFELPVDPVEASASATAPDATPDTDADGATDPPGSEHEPLTLLAVDDNEVNLEVIEGMLQVLGHRVERARNGQEAVDFLSRSHPDAVLMDMQMPVMDGLSATREIRARGLNLPVIGVTANAFAEDRAACLAAGMDDFLAKPVTADGLTRVLARVTPVRHAAPSPAPTGAEDTEQLRDLAAALGRDMVLQLVDRFEADLDDLRARLSASIPSGDAAAQDALLHSLKGAALTLGMNGSGHLAQRLRSGLPVTGQDVTDLLEAARGDIVRARVALAELEYEE